MAAAPSDDVRALVREALVHDLLYDSPVALLVVDDELRVLVANAAACRLSGYAMDELLALGPWEITADPEQSARNADRIHVGGRLAATSKLRRKDGDVVTCSYFAWEVLVSGLPFIAILLWPER